MSLENMESTENTLFLDENGRVTQNPYDTGYTEPAAVSLKRRIGVLREKEAELSQRIEDFCASPSFSEKQKRRIAEYRKDDRISSLRVAFPGCLLGYRMKYWGIKKIFIDPFNQLIDELSEIRRQITQFERQYMAITKELTEEQLERYRRSQNTTVVVTIDYDVDPGDCGNC